jgi:transcriptional regulator with XRE-family HTH domain
MVANDCDELFGFARLAPAILRSLRRMRGVSSPKMADRMHLPPRAYQDFENGRTGLLLPRICLFAKLLKMDQGAVFTAFILDKPQIALKFAQNKFQLIQASALTG